MTVTIFKDSEPQFAGTHVMPNYVTFHGFVAQEESAALRRPVTPPTHRVEFLGDSITAGFDNLCDVPNSPGGHLSTASSFRRSWAPEICNALNAECHYTAWSGLGMVVNCCGGATVGSDIWKRTLATVGSSNTSDPHGTTIENLWNFSTWKADAVVINLGTNDGLTGGRASFIDSYNQTYEAMVVAAAKSYGEETHFFLACGPMSDHYCDEVNWVIGSLQARGLKARFLDDGPNTNLDPNPDSFGGLPLGPTWLYQR